MGEIRLLAFDQFAPVDFLPCDGRSLRVSEYQPLFSLIGTTYGGDGVQTFNLPDLRGRSPVNFGQITGGTNYALAAIAGVEQVTLTSAMVPSHNHTVSVTKTPATDMIPGSAVAPGDVGSSFYYCNADQAGTNFTLNSSTIQVDGGGNQPHLNMQPSLVLAYVIAVKGLYPDFTE